MKQKFPYAYVEDMDIYQTLFDALADGASVEHVIIDNSVGFGNEVVHLRKLTMQFGWIAENAGAPMAVLLAIMRDTEGTSPIDLRSTSAVRDARNENKLLRGPWMGPLISTTAVVGMPGILTIIQLPRPPKPLLSCTSPS